MTTFFLDLENGNDATDGTTFANRWKTFASGATAARIAPGDTIRVMASPDQSLIGNATWTQNSKAVTLAAAVTANIDDGEVAWTASANVTATATTAQFKEGTKSANLVVATAFTTGKLAYKALAASTDFSAYQQTSFWIRSTVAQAAGVFEIRLCSDTTGDTAVDTIVVPALSANAWIAYTVDKAAALGAAIQSVALYATSDPGTPTINLDNILACKAAGSADALSLTSLIGKKWNLPWVLSTTYAQNDKVRPTQPNRNGFQYKKQNAGSHSSGTSEPIWPIGIGSTVTDGSVTWVCEELEDTWFPIQSINGTAVRIDNDTAELGNAGRGYAGAGETVPTYKREPIKFSPLTSSTGHNIVQDSGSANNLITFSGGWNRTDMSTQTGETWVSGQSGGGSAYHCNAKNYIAFVNLNAICCTYAFYVDGDAIRARNSHATGVTSHNVFITSNSGITLEGCNFSNGGAHGVGNSGVIQLSMDRVTLGSNNGDGVNPNAGITGVWRDIHAKNNGLYGVRLDVAAPKKITGLVTGNNASGGLFSAVDVTLINASIAESTEFNTPTSYTDRYIYSQRHDQTANNHLITTDGGTIVSATDQRHTASGISWKFSPTSTIRDSRYPLKLSVAKVACKANEQVTISIWARRDNTNIKGKLIVEGGQIPGVPADVSVSSEPTINTWAQSSNLQFTPTEDGVVEVQFWVWDGVGTINSFWIDDLA